MTEWKPFETAPKNGESIIILINCATVPIVRTAWWNDGIDDPNGAGWWSYRHSVTQEMLINEDTPIAWMPLPDDTEGHWMKIWPDVLLFPSVPRKA